MFCGGRWVKSYGVDSLCNASRFGEWAAAIFWILRIFLVNVS